MKKVLCLLLIAVMVFAFCACGSDDPEYPVLEVPQTGTNMKEASFGGFTGQYDADLYTFDVSMGQFILYQTASMDSDQAANITVGSSGKFPRELKASDLEDLMAELEKQSGMGMKIEEGALYSFDGKVIMLTEVTTKITNEMIDILIQNGTITEEYIDIIGGRDVLLAIPETHQIQVYAVVDGGYLVVFTGTYHDAQTKQEMRDAILTLIKTGKAEA